LIFDKFDSERDGRSILRGKRDVEFCGYNVPHPLEDKILIRLQTKRGVSAASMLMKGFEELECIFASIRQKFDSSYALYRTNTED
uniref:RNA_pol_L_2 domain-containing protein n=1 Tax=Brugia timori TaxID=42155 RepID=A0A0R3QG35_9BILA